MMVTYDIVHLHRDGTEEKIATVRTATEIALITETPKYLGTWIRDNRKLLRWNRGEIWVYKNEVQTVITNHHVTYLGSMPLYELTINHGDELKSICINSNTIVGYDSKKAPLWQTSSFTKLSDIIGKELCYDVLQYYEKYQAEFNVKGAM